MTKRTRIYRSRRTLDQQFRAQGRMTPRSLLAKGNPAWCYQAIDRIALLWKCAHSDSWAKELTNIIAVQAWDVVPVEQPYGSLETLVEKELECSFDDFATVVKILTGGKMSLSRTTETIEQELATMKAELDRCPVLAAKIKALSGEFVANGLNHSVIELLEDLAIAVDVV